MGRPKKNETGQVVIDKFFEGGAGKAEAKAEGGAARIKALIAEAKEKTAQPAALAPPAAAPPAAKPPKKPRAKKITVTIPSLGPAVARIHSAPPVEPEDVIEIHVRSFEHSGSTYYISDKSKLYTKNLKYVGRWNAKSESIDYYPDSDS